MNNGKQPSANEFVGSILSPGRLLGWLFRIPAASEITACFQIADGARVCDPQQCRQLESSRISRPYRGFRTPLRLTEPRSETGNAM